MEITISGIDALHTALTFTFAIGAMIFLLWYKSNKGQHG